MGVSARCSVVGRLEGAQAAVDPESVGDFGSGRSVAAGGGGELDKSVTVSDPKHSVSKCLLQSSMITCVRVDGGWVGRKVRWVDVVRLRDWAGNKGKNCSVEKGSVRRTAAQKWTLDMDVACTGRAQVCACGYTIYAPSGTAVDEC